MFLAYQHSFKAYTYIVPTLHQGKTKKYAGDSAFLAVATFVHLEYYLCLESVLRIFLLDISINSNCFEMTDTALEFLFSVIHVLISVCFILNYV